MKRMTMAVCVIAAMATASLAQAQKEGAKWETKLYGGLNLARGNTRNMLLNAGLTAERKGDPNEFSLGGEINYGETEIEKDGEKVDETNLDNAKGYAKYRRLFSERHYGYLNAETSRDEIANVRYRAIVGPGLGRYFIKSEKTTLSAEIGAAHLVEEVAGVRDDYVTARAAQGCERKIADGTRIWESVEYLPRMDNTSQYLINTEVGAEAAMAAKISLRVVLQNKYNSEPAPDKKSSDLTISAGVTYTL